MILKRNNVILETLVKYSTQFHSKFKRSMDALEKQTEQLLQSQLFPASGVEKLVKYLRVYDDKKIAPIRRHPTAQSDDDQSVKEDATNRGQKSRIICLSCNIQHLLIILFILVLLCTYFCHTFVVHTVRNNGNWRLHKVKPVSSGYQIAKSWHLDEIKTIQNIDVR